MKKRLRKLFIRKHFMITTLSSAGMGILLFIGAYLGYHGVEDMVAEQPQVEKKPSGKYAYENSEKAKFSVYRN